MRKRIYVNIMFRPKIWGFYFSSLFSVLGGFLAGLMFLSITADMTTALLLNTLFFGVLAGCLRYRDNRDEIERQARRSAAIRGRVSSFVISEQKVRLEA